MSFQPDDSILDAFALMDQDAEATLIPGDYHRAVRTGTPGSRHRITISGDTTAHITIQAQSPSPRRDVESYEQLKAAMNAVITDGIQPELPREIAMIAWEHEGRELRICAPGTASDIRRARSRLRRRLSALSPLPLLGALTQPLAGSATAVGIAIAPVVPPVHHPDIPAIPIVKEMTGEVARSELPYAPGTVTPAPTGLPWTFRPATPAPPPAEATAKDATPPAPKPPLLYTPPATPAPSGSRTVPSPDPTPTPTPTGDETGAPAEPILPTFDGPTTEASSDPTVTSEPSPEPAPTPTVSVTEMLNPVLHPTREHGKHHKRHGRHPLRGIGRHR